MCCARRFNSRRKRQEIAALRAREQRPEPAFRANAIVIERAAVRPLVFHDARNGPHRRPTYWSSSRCDASSSFLQTKASASKPCKPRASIVSIIVLLRAALSRFSDRIPAASEVGAKNPGETTTIMCWPGSGAINFSKNQPNRARIRRTDFVHQFARLVRRSSADGVRSLERNVRLEATNDFNGDRLECQLVRYVHEAVPRVVIDVVALVLVRPHESLYLQIRNRPLQSFVIVGHAGVDSRCRKHHREIRR